MEDERFEEAALLLQWEADIKALLVAPASEAKPIALVDTPDIERVRPATCQARVCLRFPGRAAEKESVRGGCRSWRRGRASRCSASPPKAPPSSQRYQTS